MMPAEVLGQGHLLRILDTVPCGIYGYYLDAQAVSHFPYFNQYFLDFLEITREELAQDGSIVWSLFHPDDRAKVVEADAVANQSGQLFFVEIRIITRRGALKWIQMSSSPTGQTVDGVEVWSGYFVDITNSKLLQTQLLQAKEQLRHAAVEAARAHERSSLMRDVHDGFGSQLSQALMMMDRGHLSPAQLQQLLQECVTDLYLVVDTFSDEETLLANAFVDYRYRVQKRLSAQPVQMDWDLDLAHMGPMPPRLILHLLRIVQELLSNSLRHAQATRIHISAQFDASQQVLHVRCADDGVGLGEVLQTGRGLRNIHQRVRELGATITFVNQTPGTQVSIFWPVSLAKALQG
jgi:PAS domain S-box-containing protein